MSLVSQFDKIVILSKRQSSVTDEKTGRSRIFLFVTGFDAVSGSVFSDLGLAEDSPIGFGEICDNRVYNGRFAYSNVNDGKNVKRISSVSLSEIYGDLDIKPFKATKA